MKKLLIAVLVLIPTLSFAGPYKSLFNRDPATGSMLSISPEHHAVHEGSRFEISSVQDLAINNVYDVQITTPNTADWSHCTISTLTEAETDIYFYENVNIILAGTALTAFNRNRNSSVSATTVYKGISNTSVANANLDTAVAGGTEIFHTKVGAGFKSGGGDDRPEFILKQNEDYSLRIVATAAGYTSYVLDCYEHDNSELH